MAAAAGVSRSTVSYVLSGSTRHSFPEETRRRVEEAASRLAYIPHAAARSLRGGDYHCVLVALGRLPFAGNVDRLLGQLTDALAQRGRSLLTWTAGGGARLADVLRDVNPGVVVEVMPLTADDRSAARGAGIPVLSIAHSVEHLERAVGALQVQHLVALGHRRLAHVTVEDALLATLSANRAQGVRLAARAHGLAVPPHVVPGALTDAGEALRPVLRRWVGGRHPVTAVCCFNDLFAGAVLLAAAREGIDVPGDLSVVGVDADPFGALLTPTLSSVRYDFAGAAAFIADSIRSELDRGAPGGGRDRMLDLVAAGSTGPAPRRRTP
ncbi:LacI family DNA-binding transcriptional regulator [Kineococcus sp. TBRC 1896]|uniref:LacI family DNA-binding transcriptional regulator n=1 Tax=Kineococcus mangrovi TaxID=1660183 RepID=A0ABV4I859_9ACTN